MIKAIIFDFGNVICTFDNNRFLNKITKYTDKFFDELNTLIYTQSDLPKLYESGRINSNDFYKGLSKLCGLRIPKEEFDEAYSNIFTPIDSTFDLLPKLKKNYKLALLSNTSELDFNLGIKPFNIHGLFDAITLSYEVGAMKPDSKIYQDSLQKLGLEPGECVYIDDIEKYCEAASQLGIASICYAGHDQLVSDLAKLGVKL